MATLGITDLRAGLGVNIKGKDCVILEAQHVKPGKGNTYVRTKYRDIRTGRVNEENFQQSAKFESVNMKTREMQYLYNDGDIYYFMDNETYEQVEVAADMIGDSAKWFKENDTCQLLYANGVLYNVQPPMFIEAEITETVDTEVLICGFATGGVPCALPNFGSSYNPEAVVEQSNSFDIITGGGLIDVIYRPSYTLKDLTRSDGSIGTVSPGR